MTESFAATLAALLIGVGPTACMLLMVPPEAEHTCCPRTPKPPCYDKCPFARMEPTVKTVVAAKAAASETGVVTTNFTRFLDSAAPAQDYLPDSHGLHLRIRVLLI